MSRPIDALLGNIDPLTGLRRGVVGGNASYMQSPVKVTGLPQIDDRNTLTNYNNTVTMRSGNNIPVRPMTNAGVIAGTPFKNNTPTLLTGTTTGQTNTGLLGDTFSDPRTVGALNSASELMKLGGYSVGKPAPTLGQAFGVGIQSYLKGKQAEEDRQSKRSQNSLKNQLEMAKYLNEVQKMQLDQQKTGKEDKKTAFTQEKNLRDALIKESKDNVKALEGFNKVAVASTAEPSGANDLALIFGYMKTIDPTSVVREGEFANAENTGGVPQRIWNIYNKVRDGVRLTATQRENFLQSAVLQVRPYLINQERLEGNYRDLATNYKLNPSLVVQTKLPTEGSYLKPIKVSSDAEAEEKLKKGQFYILPDNSMGVID
jgi:hypothetical protein